MEDKKAKIGYSFSDPSLELLAYTHPSCNAERGDNQRLEFLGDAVLDLIIAEALYHRLPDEDEGVLDRARAFIVNGKSLASKAEDWGLGRNILVSESQRKHHPEPSASMLEDALEALIGAIYLDGGLDAARKFILRAFDHNLDAIQTDTDKRNPKSRLQEWTQKHYNGKIPEYELLRSDGPDHKRHYTTSVRLNGKEIGRGAGNSIKTSEMAAAEAALSALGADE